MRNKYTKINQYMQGTFLEKIKTKLGEITKLIPLHYFSFGTKLYAASKTMIVMIFFRNEVDFDHSRTEYIKEFIKRDMRIFDQIIVVTNFGSYNNQIFTKLFLPKQWKKQIHLRVYDDNKWENAGVMRYRCFHSANQIPSSDSDQIIFIRDDRRAIIALASPNKTLGISEEESIADRLYVERLENIRTGSPMPSFSEKQTFEKLEDLEIMTVPSQMAKGRSVPEEKGKSRKPRNNSGDFSSLNQCLIFTRKTISFLWTNGMCYPPGPILEDYVFANMCYLAGLKARKTAAFLKRTGDFESYARPNDTQQQDDVVVETANCWDSPINANLAAIMAECLRFEYRNKKVTFRIGTTLKTFSLNSASGGGSYHCIAAYLSMQRLKEIIKSSADESSMDIGLAVVPSPRSSTPTIFDGVGLPPQTWGILGRRTSLVRSSSANKYDSSNNSDIVYNLSLNSLYSSFGEASSASVDGESVIASVGLSRQRSRSLSEEIEHAKKRARYT